MAVTKLVLATDTAIPSATTLFSMPVAASALLRFTFCVFITTDANGSAPQMKVSGPAATYSLIWMYTQTTAAACAYKPMPYGQLQGDSTTLGATVVMWEYTGAIQLGGAGGTLSFIGATLTGVCSAKQGTFAIVYS